MTEPALIEARNLTRVVDGETLLEDVSFEADCGELFVVFSPSGAGKSTLLRLLNRLDEPTEGTVYLEGTDYRQIPPRALRRRVGLDP
jgi:putative ABC transport system ATP-binding protein